MGDGLGLDSVAEDLVKAGKVVYCAEEDALAVKLLVQVVFLDRQANIVAALLRRLRGLLSVR